MTDASDGMTVREMIRLLCTASAGNRARAATAEARFLACRARLAFSPPGTWQRSPQNGLVRAARKETRS